MQWGVHSPEPYAMQTAVVEREPIKLPADFLLTPDQFAVVDPIARMLADPSDGLTFRQKVWRLQRHMEGMDQVPIPVEHGFADKLYMRTIVFPQGTLAVGKVHVEEHVDVMLTGSMIVFVDGGMRQVKAPYVGVTLLGGKKIGIALEETRWLTVHANPDNGRDIPAIEARLAQDGELEEFDVIEVTP